MRLSRSANEAIDVVRQGGIIAYPTEAVFGLGCDPSNLTTVQRLLSIKHRPAHKGLILVAANINQLNDFVPPLDEDLSSRVLPCWPGPITWLLPVKAEVSPLIRGNHWTIAVRVSAHPTCQQLCQGLGHPIISTSANLSGEPPLMTAIDVKESLGNLIDLVLDKPLGDRDKPSEIRNAFTGKVVRAG